MRRILHDSSGAAVHVLLLSAVVGLISCNSSCDRSGCDAFDVPAEGTAITIGIAGIAASRSDVVANGCETCTLSQGSLSIWQATQPVANEEDALALLALAPDISIEIDQRYEQALAVGDYMVCTQDNGQSGGQDAFLCVPFHLDPDQVVSAHVRASLGGTELAVYLPGEDTAVSEPWLIAQP